MAVLRHGKLTVIEVDMSSCESLVGDGEKQIVCRHSRIEKI